jgi:adenylate kinase
VLVHGERVLKPWLGIADGPRHLVIAGAPGNGKTTIAKFLVQVYRAALLQEAANLGDDHRAAIVGTTSALGRMRLSPPRHRRWPIRIDLAEYVEDAGASTGFLRWISQKISERTEHLPPLMPWVLNSWRRDWPWILVLDGLDEVSEPRTRQRLVENIVEFVGEAEAENCDILVVVTTRPTGYLDELPSEHFDRIDLAFLTPQEAEAYGTLVTKVRLRNDEERIQRVLKLLRSAAANDAMRNLLRTPLQILIMTIIAESAGQFDPDRFSLFWTYYKTVLKREQSKTGGLAPLLRDYAPQVLDLHERVGLALQQQSELASGAMAALEELELRNEAWRVLDAAGYKPSTNHGTLLDRIVQAATQRLVLIAPRHEGGYGFDVRSLQELMAARRLTTGEFSVVAPRLHAIGASPHWRNTWIFAAGRYFSEPQRFQHEAITELVLGMDQGCPDRLGAICPIGPQLALDIVDDGMALAHPRWHQRLLQHGLRVLFAPPPQDATELARVLVRAADSSPETRGLVAADIRTALGSHVTARETASRIQALIPAAVTAVGAGLEVRGLTEVKRLPGAMPEPVMEDNWSSFLEATASYPSSAVTRDHVFAAATSIQRLRFEPRGDDELKAIRSALADPEAAEILEAALGYVAADEPALVKALRDEVLSPVFRNPVVIDMSSDL